MNNFIDDLNLDLNKLPDDKQRLNFLERFRRNMFMIDEYWYRDLDETTKLKFEDVVNRY